MSRMTQAGHHEVRHRGLHLLSLLPLVGGRTPRKLRRARAG